MKVPRLYKVATSIIKSFKKGEGSVKTLVFESKKKHPNIKALFALVNECLKYEKILQEAFAELDILNKESPLDETLAFILTTELLYGKKNLPGDSKPVKTILKYQDKLKGIERKICQLEGGAGNGKGNGNGKGKGTTKGKGAQRQRRRQKEEAKANREVHLYDKITIRSLENLMEFFLQVDIKLKMKFYSVSNLYEKIRF